MTLKRTTGLGHTVTLWMLAVLAFAGSTVFAHADEQAFEADPAKRPAAMKCAGSLIYTNIFLNQYIPEIRDQPSAAAVGKIAKAYSLSKDDVEIPNLASAKDLLGCKEIGIRDAHIDMLIFAMSGHDLAASKEIVDGCGKGLFTTLLLADKAGRGFFDTVSETKAISALLAARYRELYLLYTDAEEEEQKRTAMKDLMATILAANRAFPTFADNIKSGFVTDMSRCFFIGIDPLPYLEVIMKLKEEQ